jgi:hypothetical protein
MALIRRAAGKVEGIGFRRHCLKRMTRRQIDAEDVVLVLQNGVLVGKPQLRREEWRYRIRERRGNTSPERQEIEVVVVIVDDGEIEAHTVYRRHKG